MLSPASIARYVTAGRTGQLLEALIANGQYLPPVIKVQLLQAGHSPALALGLKRVLELSHMATPATERLAIPLLDAQCEDGSFDHDPIATALALTALDQLMTSHPDIAPQACDACMRALEALVSMRSADGLFYPQTHDQSLRQAFSAYILQLLARNTQAREQLSLDRLLATLGQSQQSLGSETQSYLRIARISLPEKTAVRAA